MENKIAVVVVLYNPNNIVRDNILSYSKSIDKIYVVDNSNTNNFSILKSISNIEYIPNYKNLGIAKALNQGCQKALQDGFSWCMTMDQDSSWEKINLDKYISFFYKFSNQDSTVKSFTPWMDISDVKSVYTQIKRKIKKIFNIPVCDNSKPKDKEYVFLKRCISSGNIISLKIWEKINFDEKLFIDEVDFDFCYRLYKLNSDYKIVQYLDTVMKHIIGEPQKTILPKEFHSEFRTYYILRNRMYCKKKYPDICKEFNYSRDIKYVFLCNFVRKPIQTIKISIKAKKDCNKMFL